MNEKEAIEKATAEGFLRLFNESYGDSYRIIEHGDAPDMRCANDRGEILNLEITLTENRPMDIAAQLGRSDHRSIESLQRHMEDVSAGRSSVRFDSLSGNASAMLVSRIKAKLNRDLGRHVALVVRDSCPLDWNWEFVLDDIRARLSEDKSPFDKGIWLVSYSKDKLYMILGPA